MKEIEFLHPVTPTLSVGSRPRAAVVPRLRLIAVSPVPCDLEHHEPVELEEDGRQDSRGLMSPGELARECGRRSNVFGQELAGQVKMGLVPSLDKEGEKVQRGRERERGMGNDSDANAWKVLSSEPMATSPPPPPPPPPPTAAESSEGRSMMMRMQSPEPREAELQMAPPSAIPPPPARLPLVEDDDADAQILIRWSEPLDSSERQDNAHIITQSLLPPTPRVVPKLFSVGLTPPAALHGAAFKTPRETPLLSAPPSSSISESMVVQGCYSVSRPSAGFAAGKARLRPGQQLFAQTVLGRGQGGNGGGDRQGRESKEGGERQGGERGRELADAGVAASAASIQPSAPLGLPYPRAVEVSLGLPPSASFGISAIPSSLSYSIPFALPSSLSIHPLRNFSPPPTSIPFTFSQVEYSSPPQVREDQQQQQYTKQCETVLKPGCVIEWQKFAKVTSLVYLQQSHYRADIPELAALLAV
jgi:hypothetical protein